MLRGSVRRDAIDLFVALEGALLLRCACVLLSRAVSLAAGPHCAMRYDASVDCKKNQRLRSTGDDSPSKNPEALQRASFT
jgi:hypothetical protein